MNPTLAEILTYEPFRRADARVVAGESNLNRPVRWVHISEMPSPGRLFRGGELLLTQGRGISQDPVEQRRLVRELAEAGVAGAAIETGVIFAQLPSALVAEAQAASLPLVSLRHPAYFMDMTEAVHSAIVNRQYGLLQRTEAINRKFSRLVVQGAGLGSLISELAYLVGNPVVLADQARQVLEFSPETPEFLDWLRDWQAHARVGHQAAPDGSPVRCASGAMACTWAPVIVRGESQGAIHVLESAKTCDEADHLAVDRAKAAIELVFAVAFDVERQEADARSVLVHDLVRGHCADPRQARRRAAAFGTDLGERFRVAVFRPVGGPWNRVGESGNRGLSQALRAVSGAAQRCLGEGDKRPLVGYDGGQVVAIVAEPDARSAAIAGRCAAVLDQCGAMREGIQLAIGLSDRTDLAGLPDAFTEAEDTVRYVLRTGRAPAVLLSEDLGINRLLLALDEGSTLARHIERELGSLLNYDAGAAAPLLPTLAAYLEFYGRKAEAARALHIQRRTLYYRLERLQQLVRGSLDDTDTRLRLLIALRGLEFRERRPTPWLRHHRNNP